MLPENQPDNSIQTEATTGDDIPTIAYMCGSADSKDYIREHVRWFLEIWQMVPPSEDDAYDECERSLIHALNEVAKAVGITEPVKHWSENMNISEKTDV